jgi:hypothetical protein
LLRCYNTNEKDKKTEEDPGKYGMHCLYEVGRGFMANTMKWKRRKRRRMRRRRRRRRRRKEEEEEKKKKKKKNQFLSLLKLALVIKNGPPEGIPTLT